MAQDLVVQRRHSRNKRDWKLVTEAGGRHVFYADDENEGVYERMARLMGFLKETPRQGKQAMGVFLHGLDPSHRRTDVDQPIRQMLKHNIVKREGYGRAAVYSLTNNGQRIYDHFNVIWIGG